MKLKGLIYICLLPLFLWSCGDDKTQFEKDIEKIENYLRDNNITATRDDSGIFYTIDVEGTGDNPSPFATVIIKYKGQLLETGTVFDQTVGNQTAQFALVNTIRGFQIGTTLLKRGGKGTFYIPSGLGYGRFGEGNDIPGNAALIFEIELIDFQN